MRRSPIRLVARRLILLVSLALVATFGLVVLPASVPNAHAADRTATLVGSLQSELGCSADWQPDCAATRLAKDPAGTTYSKDFTVPAGEWEYKLALNGGWDESYGPDGSGNNGPLVLAGNRSCRRRMRRASRRR